MNRKLDIGNVLTRTFETYREQFTLLVPAALLLFIPIAVLNGLVLTGGGVLAVLIAAGIGVIATFWFQGMVVEAVQDIMDGRRDHTVGSLFSSVAPVVGPLIGAGILAGIGIAIGLVLLIVPGLILLTLWAVLAPVIVVERTGVLGAFGRSQQLVKPSALQVFGVIVLLFLITFIVSAILQGIFNAISDSFVAYALADLIVRALVSPLSAVAAAVMYFELKGAHGEQVPAAGEGAAVGAGAPAGDTAQQPEPVQPGGGPEAPPGGGSQSPPGGGPQPPSPGGPQSPDRPPGT